MVETISYLIDFCTKFISDGGILFGFFIVFIECLIPVLPLSVFVALNVNAFGLLQGIIISWIATCMGSYLCYILCYKIGNKLKDKVIKRKLLEQVNSKVKSFKNISFTKLVLVITVPFTPSFLINIVCGYARVKRKKYLAALLIGKVFSMIFWGYIGKTLIESLTDVKALIYVAITLILAFIISKLVNKLLDVE